MKDILFYFIFLCITSGCARYSDLFHSSFYQSHRTNIHFQNQAKSSIKSAALHDIFATVTLVDALWISDRILSCYTTLVGQRLGFNDLQIGQQITHALEQSANYITFCVLLSPDEKKNIISVTDARARWSVLLYDDQGVAYPPVDIKRVDLPQEYVFLFGKKYSIFKGVYFVLFSAYTKSGKKIINDQTDRIRLCFHSVEYQMCLDWYLYHQDVCT